MIVVIALAFKAGLIPPDSSKVATISLAFVLQLQISALFLNLLPVPPLDGFQAIAPWLRPELRERLFGLSNVGLFILFLSLWYVEPLNHAFWSVVHWGCGMVGVNSHWGYLGYQAFRFWDH
jgi:Zn-dependent protease